MPAEGLKERIKQCLEELGLSARQASLKAGLAADTLGKVVAGKTRNLRGDHLSAVARSLRVSEMWLTSGTDQAPVHERGFAESDAAQYSSPLDNPNQSSWAVSAQFSGPSGYLPGDRFILQMGLDPKDGDDVLATIADLKGGGYTVLRRFRRGWLMGGPEAQPEYVDGARVVVMGVIIKSWRERMP